MTLHEILNLLALLIVLLNVLVYGHMAFEKQQDVFDD